MTAEEFNNKRELFETSPNFKRAFLFSEEYNDARKIESETNYEISFYDIIHMLLAKKTKSIFITRDYKLIEIAERYFVEVKKPEEIL